VGKGGNYKGHICRVEKNHSKSDRRGVRFGCGRKRLQGTSSDQLGNCASPSRLKSPLTGIFGDKQYCPDNLKALGCMMVFSPVYTAPPNHMRFVAALS